MINRRTGYKQDMAHIDHIGGVSALVHQINDPIAGGGFQNGFVPSGAGIVKQPGAQGGIGHIGLVLVASQGVVGVILIVRFARLGRVLDAQLVKVAAVFRDFVEHFIGRRLGRFLSRLLLLVRGGGRGHRFGILAFGGNQQRAVGNLVDGSLVGDIRGVQFIIGEVIVLHQILLVAFCQSLPVHLRAEHFHVDAGAVVVFHNLLRGHLLGGGGVLNGFEVHFDVGLVILSQLITLFCSGVRQSVDGTNGVFRRLTEIVLPGAAFQQGTGLILERLGGIQTERGEGLAVLAGETVEASVVVIIIIRGGQGIVPHLHGSDHPRKAAALQKHCRGNASDEQQTDHTGNHRNGNFFAF